MLKNGYRRIMSEGALGIAVALFAVVLAAPGSATAASSHNVGNGPGTETARCRNSQYLICLNWYGNGGGAYWGYSGAPGTGDTDLGNNYFLSGTGTGAGVRVRNNAASIDCDRFAPYDCATYVSPGYSGNVDYLFSGQFGTLFFTWNNEASTLYV